MEKYEIELEYYNTNIEELINGIEDLNIRLSRIESEEKLLQSHVDHADSTYNALLNKIEATRIAEASKIAENSIVVISDAFEPTIPTGPNNMLNVAIGIVLGGMISVFFVFFRSYWKNN